MNLNNGYIEIYIPQHPNARANGTMLEHRLVAEEKLGRYLKPEETVHHLDENRTNNNPDNLIVFRTTADHTRFHKIGIMEEMDDGTYICPVQESEIKKCKYCGSYYIYDRFNKRNKYCSWECYLKNKDYNFKKNVENNKIPTKETLNFLIHNVSFVKIGEMYHVSDNAVRKWCKKYELPYKYSDLHKKEQTEVKPKRLFYDNAHQVKMYNIDIEKIFDSLDDAVEYLIDNKITKENVSKKGIRDNISNAHRKNSMYRGFYWKIFIDTD